jgi:hypothetical protein
MAIITTTTSVDLENINPLANGISFTLTGPDSNGLGTSNGGWRSISGSTGSSSTGPTGPHSGSYYWYTETSGTSLGEIFIMEMIDVLDCSDATGYNYLIDFWYSNYGSGGGGQCLVQFWNGSTWITVQTIGWSTTVSAWKTATQIDLSSFTNSDGKLRWHFTTGGGTTYQNDFALDDMLITVTGVASSSSASSSSVSSSSLSYSSSSVSSSSVSSSSSSVSSSSSSVSSSSLSSSFSAQWIHEGLFFTTDGDADWFLQSSTIPSGAPSAFQSGVITDDQYSRLDVRIFGVGQLRFNWKVSSELNYDKLSFYIDDVLQADISGDIDWNKSPIYIVSAGEPVYWVYSKDENITDNDDVGWVGDFSFFLGSSSSSVSSSSSSVSSSSSSVSSSSVSSSSVSSSSLSSASISSSSISFSSSSSSESSSSSSSSSFSSSSFSSSSSSFTSISSSSVSFSSSSSSVSSSSSSSSLSSSSSSVAVVGDLRHVWYTLLDKYGEPIPGASVYTYKTGTLVPLFMWDYTGWNVINPPLTTTSAGIFDFFVRDDVWVNDDTSLVPSDTGGYPWKQDFKIVWSDVTRNGVVDDIPLWGKFEKALNVYGESSNTNKNRTYNNEEAYNIDQHLLKSYSGIHGLESLTWTLSAGSDDNSRFNKLVSNSSFFDLKLKINDSIFPFIKGDKPVSKVIEIFTTPTITTSTKYTTFWVASGGFYYADVEHYFGFLIPMVNIYDRDSGLIVFPETIEFLSNNRCRVWMLTNNDSIISLVADPGADGRGRRIWEQEDLECGLTIELFKEFVDFFEECHLSSSSSSRSSSSSSSKICYVSSTSSSSSSTI